VLTVHKSTLKRRPKTSRSDSVKPLMDREETQEELSNGEEEEEDEEKRIVRGLNKSALSALGYSSESTRKSKASPSSR